MTLRAQTIRLAHENPELRAHLLPLLTREAKAPTLSKGTKVKVPHKGKMVDGVVVRFDPGSKARSPFYVVDVGDYASAKVPPKDVKTATSRHFGIASDSLSLAEHAGDPQQAIYDVASAMESMANGLDRVVGPGNLYSKALRRLSEDLAEGRGM